MTGAPQLATELIASKYRVPTAREEILVRTRLLEQLAGKSRPIVLIRAPAGYGKSTLLQQWAACEPRPVAFVRLDQAESDLVLFWRYLVAALKTIEPDLVGEADRELQGRMPLIDDVVVPRLLNALDRHDGQLVLMLDDFYRIEGSSVPASLRVFMEHIPGSLTLAIASRPDPRLSLAGLRARGRVHDIDMNEMRFTMEETVAAVAKIDATRSKRDIQAIHVRTEGWATGIYLAGRHGARLPPTAPPQEIHRYLISEMLDDFDAEDRGFMQATSILDELDPDLCDAVTQRVDSGQRLRRLSDSNLMLVPLDGALAYRYHHLLQETLRFELRATQDRDAIWALHDRAFRWELEQGHLSEAIHHAIGAGAIGEAVEVVCHNWFDFVLTGRLLTAERWISWFDDPDFSAYPSLAVAGALVSAFAGDAHSVERLSRLAARLDFDGDPMDGSITFESSVAIMSATLGLDGPRVAGGHAQRALELEPETSPWRPLMKAIVAVCLILEADDSQLDDSLVRAAAMTTGPLGVNTYVLGSLSLVAAWRGRWGTAQTHASEAIRLIEELHIGDLVTSGLPYAVSAVISGRQGDDARARQLLAVAEQALQRRGGGFLTDSLLLSLTVAEAQLELGRPNLAMVQLEYSRRVLAKLGEGGRAEYRVNKLFRETERMLRSSPDDDADDRVALLSARELQVVGLLRTGLTLEQIGERLFISRDTVKTHARRSYRKLGAHGRDEAVAEAERLGIV
jgi:LuxR family maltose regulon positive regulatory protein